MSTTSTDTQRLDQEALRSGSGAVEIDRAVVRVAGPEAVPYLQGQLSQDVEGLAVGRSAWSFVLQPQGKVAVWLRVTRLADDELLLDTEAVAGDALAERLLRFKLRTNFDLERLPWRCLALRGAAVPELDLTTAAVGAGTAVAAALWPSLPAVDLLGPQPVPPAGVRVCSAEAYEALRIEEGVPAMGKELSDATIPAEAGPWVIGASVSFTKGCYTGQELVARIDSRGGNVPRPVRLLRVAGEAVPAPGAEVLAGGGKLVGRVTSAAWSVRAGGPLALAVVARSVAPGATVELAAGDGAITTATVSEPPL